MSLLLSCPFSTASGHLASFWAFLASLELTPSFSAVFFSLERAVFSWNIADIGNFLRKDSGRSLSCGSSRHSSNSALSSSESLPSSGSARELAIILVAKLLECLAFKALAAADAALDAFASLSSETPVGAPSGNKSICNIN